MKLRYKIEDEDVIVVWKNWGETPLEVISWLRNEGIINSGEKATYAGRLDPAAEGVTIILKGEARFKKEDFTNLPKTYQFSYISGISTDTYDLLGLVTTVNPKECGQPVDNYDDKHVENFLKSLENLDYPPFSSKPVNSVPLWLQARNQIFVENYTAPTTISEIYSFKTLNTAEVNSEEILKKVDKITNIVNGEFRQSEIKQSWNRALSEYNKHTWIMKSIEIECSSGTYVRGIVNEIGRRISCGAVTYSITRTKVGKFHF